MEIKQNLLGLRFSNENERVENAEDLNSTMQKNAKDTGHRETQKLWLKCKTA